MKNVNLNKKISGLFELIVYWMWNLAKHRSDLSPSPSAVVGQHWSHTRRMLTGTRNSDLLSFFICSIKVLVDIMIV